MKKFLQCLKGIAKYIDQSFDAFTRLKKEQLNDLAEANKKGDSEEVKRIVEGL